MLCATMPSVGRADSVKEVDRPSACDALGTIYVGMTPPLGTTGFPKNFENWAVMIEEIDDLLHLRDLRRERRWPEDQ
jgi:hypothetical protein